MEIHIIFSDDSFVFEKYIISHKGEFGYRCYMDNALLWEFKGQGYLYTEMERYGNMVVFGTAGAGGHFYGIDINTGQSIIDINTKGTRKYCYQNNCFYIYQCGPKGKLLKVGINGEVNEEIILPGLVTTVCPLALINNRIYTLFFTKKKKEIYPVIACYSI